MSKKKANTTWNVPKDFDDIFPPPRPTATPAVQSRNCQDCGEPQGVAGSLVFCAKCVARRLQVARAEVAIARANERINAIQNRPNDALDAMLYARQAMNQPRERTASEMGTIAIWPGLDAYRERCSDCNQLKAIVRRERGAQFCAECVERLSRPIQDNSYIGLYDGPTRTAAQPTTSTMCRTCGVSRPTAQMFTWNGSLYCADCYVAFHRGGLVNPSAPVAPVPTPAPNPVLALFGKSPRKLAK